MSRLAELIEELCPDGVEYRPLGDVAELKRGQAVTRKEIVEGQIPVIAGGREPAYYIDRPNRQGETIVIAGSGAYAGFVSFWNEPIFVSDAFSIVVDRGTLQPRFVYHWLNGMQEAIHALKSGGGVPHVYPKDVAKLRCPIPPLEVQREIVRILDQFTTLEAELEAELEARRTQYEHYRNHLLSYESLADCGPVSLVPLRECIELCFGERITKTQHAGTLYPVYGGGGASFMTDSFNRADEFVISRFALSEACVRFVSGEFWLLDSGITFNVNELCCDKRYVGQFLLSRQNDIYRRSAGAAQRNLKIAEFLSMEVPLPGLAEQRRIADLLDRFDALVNDISSGLPAEIAARRAQYEHYRDRLLSFPEKAASGDDVP